MRSKLSLKGFINNSVKSLSKIAGISLALMLLVSLDANSQTTVRLEAEDAIRIDAGLTVSTEVAGFSGDGYVSAVGDAGKEQIIGMKVNVATDGYYNIVVGYENSIATSNNSVIVNEQWVGAGMNYPVTSGFEEIPFGYFLLTAGDNDILFYTVDSNINIDYVDVTKIDDPAVTPFYEAEDATITGGDKIVASLNRPYSGTGYIDHDWDNVITIKFDVNVTDAGTHKLVIRHAKSGGRKLSINGGETTDIDLAGIGLTNDWTTTQIYVDLIAGDNTIEFQPSWGGVLFDYIDVQPLTGSSFALTVESGSSDQPVGDILEGTLVTLTADPAPVAGEEFNKWVVPNNVYLTSPTLPTTTFNMPDGAVTATATYGVFRSLTVTGGWGSNGRLLVGSKAIIGANTAPEGKVFDKWIGDVTGMDDVTKMYPVIIIQATDATVEATYKNITYTLTVTDGSGSGDYEEAEDVAIVAAAAPTGEVFDAWTGDVTGITDVSAPTTIITMPASDATIVATYKNITYNLTVTGGSGSGDYEEAEDVAIVAAAAPTGEVFDAWTGDVTGIADVNAATTTITMPASAATIMATYKTDPSLAISDEFESSFNVYPNPVNNGVLNIQAIGNVSNFVTITNLVGQQVFTAEFSGNSTKVSTSSFTKGIYFVTLKSGNNVSTKRVIIE